MTTPRLILLSVILLVVTPACVLDDVAFEEDDVWSCTVDEDCLGDNQRCTQGRCVTALFDCRDNDGDQAFAGADCADNLVLDCDDANDSTFPGATELCDNQDNDCDGEIDEDVAAVQCPLQQGVCAGAMTTCVDGAPAECDATVYGADYVETETNDPAVCGDGLDNDCDGMEDEDCPDCIEGEQCGVGGCFGAAVDCACQFGTRRCMPDGSSSCLDSNDQPVIFPGTQVEQCGNNVDDDCNGQADEGC